jgi:hypothetical protein
MVEKNWKIEEGKSISKTYRKVNLSHGNPIGPCICQELSQFMHTPRFIHMETIDRILRYLKKLEREYIWKK